MQNTLTRPKEQSNIPGSFPLVPLSASFIPPVPPKDLSFVQQFNPIACYRYGKEVEKFEQEVNQFAIKVLKYAEQLDRKAYTTYMAQIVKYIDYYVE